jgi:peptidoglycan hydrolase-like protein with peptidoglycan-binding domain
MENQIVVVVIGFVLTSIVGGFIGYYFQKITWHANRRESERLAAAGLFDEVSRAMDRRLYRMWLLHWALRSDDDARIRRAMDAYRTVLLEWNDNLNRSLALAYRYFGEGVWTYLDRVLYEDFARLGGHLEVQLRERRGARAEPAKLLEVQLQALSNDVYVVNRFMISLIQHGAVGLYQTKKGKWPERPPWAAELKRGSEGPRVAEWQRDLNLVRDSLALPDSGPIVVDGRFGPATYEATVAFQRQCRLKADGIVGVQTRSKMNPLAAERRQPTW